AQAMLMSEGANVLQVAMDSGFGSISSFNKSFRHIAGKAASQLYGGWYEGTVRSTSHDLKGKWGVYRMPSLTADGPH
ncbi:hypothetical protein ACC719_37155, partial [Rhizobium ruizarguesonis]